MSPSDFSIDDFTGPHPVLHLTNPLAETLHEALEMGDLDQDEYIAALGGVMLVEALLNTNEWTPSDVLDFLHEHVEFLTYLIAEL
jgi:hypothetical protein